MDAPFERKENRKKELEPIGIRGSFAVKALRYYEGLVKQLAFEGEREAIDLAVRYLSSRIELSLNFIDADSIPFDEDHANRILNTDKYSHYDRTERGRMETAIRDAQQGNYHKLRWWLKRDSAQMTSRKIGVSSSDEKAIGEALRKLSDIVPHHSDYHAKLYPPAYLDPRFNPDATPLPLDLQGPSDK